LCSTLLRQLIIEVPAVRGRCLQVSFGAQREIAWLPPRGALHARPELARLAAPLLPPGAASDTAAENTSDSGAALSAAKLAETG
jgi:hypothetical protein